MNELVDKAQHLFECRYPFVIATIAFTEDAPKTMTDQIIIQEGGTYFTRYGIDVTSLPEFHHRLDQVVIEVINSKEDASFWFTASHDQKEINKLFVKVEYMDCTNFKKIINALNTGKL